MKTAFKNVSEQVHLNDVSMPEDFEISFSGNLDGFPYNEITADGVTKIRLYADENKGADAYILPDMGHVEGVVAEWVKEYNDSI